MNLVQKMATRHLEKAIADPDLRARLTPDYAIGCKRILPSNRWYPTLTKPNVDIVTDGIDHVRSDGIVTSTGELRQVDTIIFATGFHVTDIRIADLVTGRSGRTLTEEWHGSPRAYRGTTVPGFPNLFFLVGPNTGLGHNSIIFMIEAQLAYVMDALEHMRARNASRLDVRPEAERAYNAHIQAKLARSVWNTGGCSSWYLDRNGRNATIWPDFTFRFWGQMRRFDPQAYELAGPRQGTGAEPALAPA
jgi:cation diffusion facilitator CzcD-associated flavoprotein CzcO